MEYEDEPMSSSPILDHSLNTSSSSAPSTPHFASTSDVFQFFPTKPMSTAVATRPSIVTKHTAIGSNLSALEQMHSDPFGDLHSAVSEAGEGFVRRMREMEASRSVRGLRMVTISPPSSSAMSHIGPADRRSSLPMRTRGRKRPSRTCPSSAGVVQSTPGRPLVAPLTFDDDDESEDVEIRSSCASGSDDVPNWSPSKKRAVSLSALSAKASTSAASLPYPIPLRSRDRSSSPLGSAYSSSSEDDEDYALLGRRLGNRRNSRLTHRRAPRFVSSSHATNTAKLSTSPPPLSFSFSTSNNSSRMSLLNGSSPASAGNRHDLPQEEIDCETPGRSVHASTSNRSSKKTERAVAALSLALANGAGSVSDYEALREAKDVLSLDYSEAGSMWD